MKSIMRTISGIAVLSALAAGSASALQRGEERSAWRESLAISGVDLAAHAAALRAETAQWSAQAPLLAGLADQLMPHAAMLRAHAADLVIDAQQLSLPFIWAELLGGVAQDSVDGLYRRARAEFNRGNYDAAIEAFRELQRRHGNSRYVPQAMYYEAFSLYRKGGDEDLRRALQVLEAQIDRHPDNVTSDTASLAARIHGALAQRGDAGAAERVVELAQELADSRRGNGQEQTGSCSDDDARMAALNALMHMDADNALPILRRVLQNRAAGCVEMRRRAIFVVAQQRSSEREEILLEAAQNDPDLEVRKHAVFHLSQVRTDAAVDALDSILRSSQEPELQERAIFALSQHHSARAAEILQTFARRADAPSDLRAHAIQWLGQSRQTSGQFLRDLYRELTDEDLREKVIFALSQQRDEGNADFLLSIAVDADEPQQMRKRALFWVGQMRDTAPRLYELYDQMTDHEMREQLIFVYSQRSRDEAALDKLIDIARNETDRELRNKAIFWLGQSKDPRAVRVLEEIINND